MNYIDAHCHLADPRLDEGRAEIIDCSRVAGVTGWVQGGYDPADWDRQLALKVHYPGIIPAFGLHPWWVMEKSWEEIARALAQLQERIGDAVALGETGLDYGPRFEQHPDSKVKQREAFEAQLRLASQRNMPVVLHIVKAHSEALEVLGEVGVPKCGGLVHSFSGSAEVARQYVQLGITVSISGAVARKGFETLKKAVVTVPGSSLVVETDSPDQAIAGSEHINEPAELVRVAEALGALRGETCEKVLRRSTDNVVRIFGLKEWTK